MISIKGAWDVHVHTNPSIFNRWGDAWELAKTCKKTGMAGVVLKAHHGSTVETANLINKQISNFKVYGGVVLNSFVGGLNPSAVDTCVSLGGKIVWLPTIHSLNHARKIGLGTFSFQKPKTKTLPRKGISIVDKNGLKHEVKEILDIMNKKNVVLATGHISSKEIFALHDYIKKENIKVPLLINHVLFTTSSFSIKQLKKLNDKRTWFGICYISLDVHATTAEKVAMYLKALPDAQWVMSSDSGKVNSPKSPEALKIFSNELLKQGISEKRIKDMMVSQPKKLLRI